MAFLLSLVYVERSIATTAGPQLVNGGAGAGDVGLPHVIALTEEDICEAVVSDILFPELFGALQEYHSSEADTHR